MDTNMSIGMKVCHVEMSARNDFLLLLLCRNPKPICMVARVRFASTSSDSFVVTGGNSLLLIVVAITATGS